MQKKLTTHPMLRDAIAVVAGKICRHASHLGRNRSTGTGLGQLFARRARALLIAIGLLQADQAVGTQTSIRIVWLGDAQMLARVVLVANVGGVGRQQWRDNLQVHRPDGIAHDRLAMRLVGFADQKDLLQIPIVVEDEILEHTQRKRMWCMVFGLQDVG